MNFHLNIWSHTIDVKQGGIYIVTLGGEQMDKKSLYTVILLLAAIIGSIGVVSSLYFQFIVKSKA